jgi:hypothetical protein
MGLITIPISFGELIDKIAILEIKSARMRDLAKHENVIKELELLTNAWLSSGHANAGVERQRTELKSVNELLWGIEDQLRLKEANGEFDAEFVELARAVYLNNDRRAALKREINLLLGSEIVEEKSYPDYRHNGIDNEDAVKDDD